MRDPSARPPGIAVAVATLWLGAMLSVPAAVASSFSDRGDGACHERPGRAGQDARVMTRDRWPVTSAPHRRMIGDCDRMLPCP